jgi:hypothetical protein
VPAVSFSDAAAALGHSSRSTLYRLRDDGRLADYLRPGGRGGAQLLELAPPCLPSLHEHVSRVVRLQINTPGSRKAGRGRVDRRWGAAAAALSEALEQVGGLSLTPEEAAAIAAALPAAVVEAFGWAGALQLRQLLEQAEADLPAPAGEPVEAQPAGGEDPLAFYRDWGRVVDPAAEPLEGEAYWREVGAWIDALEGTRGPATPLVPYGPPPPEPRPWAAVASLADMLPDVEEAVAAGARFDLARWDAYTVREFLLPDAADGCAKSAAELRAMVDAGRVPAELLEQAAAVLAAAAPLGPLPSPAGGNRGKNDPSQ